MKEAEPVVQTYNQLFLDARRRFKADGISAAQLEAAELFCFATGKSKTQFYRDLPLYASDAVVARMEDLVTRRLSGEPVAYIIGEWEFAGLPLDISPDVLVPREDSLILVERAIALARTASDEPRVLDLCAGSGCIGLAIAARVEQSRVVLADLSEGALRICRQNVRRNRLNARVTCMLADAMEAPPPGLWDFDLIVCNPPYIPTGDLETLDKSVQYEPRMALDGGADGLEFYRAVSERWSKSLRLGGSLLFEVGIGQVGEVERILLQNSFTDIKTHLDTAGIWRVVEGTIHN